MAERKATLQRKTNETEIEVSINLDCQPGSASAQVIDISTGIGFLDHMYHALAKHSGMSLTLKAKGDLWIDDHHTADKLYSLSRFPRGAAHRGTARHGRRSTDSLVVYTGHSDSAWYGVQAGPGRSQGDPEIRDRLRSARRDLGIKREKIGDLSTEMFPHIFYSFAIASGCTLHVDVLRGENDHHRAESAFKALALAIRQAIERTGGNDVPSTKGVL
ncbi:hypothetical protein EVG20_g5569 [Dentipellis fragilis]|uniref:Imidazoleglycerol-phosphate dehydratase n=1 Tax=Dentipellis fragilis TaxID=205917 RepID=A0A4Y9YUV1_9AGAM|nr:hypothetical protein EVG20_g5569 [Dentipellis fragilis]